MVKAENLILEGKYFVAGKSDVDSANTIKKLITQIMNYRSYYSKNEPNPFNPSKYLSITFDLDLPQISSHFKDRCKKNFGIITKAALNWEKYQKSLKSIRDDVPLTVSFNLLLESQNLQTGITIIVRSEPAIIVKMRTLGRRPKIDDFDYSTIIDTGKQFIKEVMTSFTATEIEEPKTLNQVVFTPTLEKLDKYGFTAVTNLMKEGQGKIQKGNTEDGLTDIREAISLFVVELVKRTGKKPIGGIGSISKNLDLLKELGYLDHWTHDLVNRNLNDWIYRYLSAKSVHGREKISSDDAEFVYRLTEEVLSYLSEKIVLGR
jgi:hypothetical protein